MPAFLKPNLRLFLAAFAALFISSCANKSSDDGLGYGPFDADGNYREDLADNPSAWTKPGKRGKVKPVEQPVFAANDQVPVDSTPLVTRNDTVQHPQPLVTESKPPVVASRPKPKTTKVASKPKVTSKKTVVKAKPKVRPKKPTVTRYVVKKGDSLSRIASRNGTSVSALKRQNGLSRDLIRPGQSLAIPKR